MRTLGVLVLAVGLIACGESAPVATEQSHKLAELRPTIAEAESIVRALDPPRAPTFYAMIDEDLEALHRAGLIRFSKGFIKKDISLTESGTAAGLKIERHEDAEFDRSFGPKGVIGDLCSSAFHRVATIKPQAGGPLPAARITYEYRNTPQPLHANMLPLAGGFSGFLRTSIANCDPAMPVVQDTLVVKREDGWRVNQLPVLDSDMMRIETSFRYDTAGILVGATTVFTITGAPTDPDGDPVQGVGWNGLDELDYDTMEMIPSPRMKIEGTTVTFDRIIRMGEPVGGTAEYKVRDPWEEKSFRFCAEGARFRC